MNNLKERLANYAHEAWSEWMRYMFSKTTFNKDGTATIPKELVERWTFQMDTKYSDLPENMKKSDREEANKIISISAGS